MNDDHATPRSANGAFAHLAPRWMVQHARRAIGVAVLTGASALSLVGCAPAASGTDPVLFGLLSAALLLEAAVEAEEAQRSPAGRTLEITERAAGRDDCRGTRYAVSDVEYGGRRIGYTALAVEPAPKPWPTHVQESECYMQLEFEYHNWSDYCVNVRFTARQPRRLHYDDTLGERMPPWTILTLEEEWYQPTPIFATIDMREALDFQTKATFYSYAADRWACNPR